jgi:hypothetical protein
MLSKLVMAWGHSLACGYNVPLLLIFSLQASKVVQLLLSAGQAGITLITDTEGGGGWGGGDIPTLII